MCTLLALHRCFPEAPLVIAANRDEYLDRAASGPAIRRVGARNLLYPTDLKAGGTWLGWSETGLFAGLTNRPTQTPNPDRPSRGALVVDALQANSAKEAAENLFSIPADRYNPCNVFVADDLDAFVVVLEGQPRLQKLEPGAHVIGNADPNDRGNAKIARLLEESAPIASGSFDGAPEALAGLLRMHVESGDTRTPLEATCIHAGPYGTRSSTLFVRGHQRQGDRLLYAEGAPCATSYDDMTPLLGELDQAAGSPTGNR